MKAEAEQNGVAIDILWGTTSDIHGPASAIALLDGKMAERFGRGWIGTVQWTCPSPIRPQHKRKNWFLAISHLPDVPLSEVDVDPSELRFETFRAGGPGGQHQNTTDSAVRALHVPTGLCAVARDERSQHRNKALAAERLAQMLKLRGEIDAIADQQLIQASHDQIERGNPVRRFSGPRFRQVGNEAK
jgi:peptide chain release factor